MAKYTDLKDKIFNRLTVKEYYGNDKRGSALWVCDCDCGTKGIVVKGSSLISKHTKSCGCYNKEMVSKSTKISNKKYNKYDLSGEYGIGFTSNGDEFYFDLEDYNKIKEYCWYISDTGYVMSHADKNKHVRMHRIITNAQEDYSVDHINHNTTDNRKINLRICIQLQNMKNQQVSKANISGVTGVTWNKINNVWNSKIEYNHKQKYLGSFINKNDAIKARLEAERIYFGEFSPQKHLYKEYGIGCNI